MIAATLPAPVRSTLASLTAFWNGLVTPTPRTCLYSVGVFAAVLASVCAVFSPDRLAGPLGAYLPASPRDNESFVTREALQLARTTPQLDPRPHLHVIGSSIEGHAFVDPQAFAQALQAGTGQRWQVSLLTTPRQGAIDEAAIADYATRGVPGVTLLPFGPIRFGPTEQEERELVGLRRLGLPSPWAADQTAAIGEQPRFLTGIYALDARDFLANGLPGLLRNLLTGRRPPRRVDAYSPDQLDFHDTPEQDRKLTERFRQSIIRGTRPDAQDRQQLANIVGKLRERGSIVILFEEPVNLSVIASPADRLAYARYLAAAPDLAKRLGAHYCRPTGAAVPAVSDFVDRDHLGAAAAQAAMRATVARCVAQAISAEKRT